ncbi:unnamed protein product [Durusdinium trenchii]|uniref:Uncharacterized protein n=1 Tax=Durusdinium trenchii TaxID=1381693 RepID=A0ABP0INE3_9DINO
MLAQVYKHGSSVEFFMLDQETAARVQVASRVTTLRCEYSDLAAKLMNKEALAAFAQPDVLLGCDVLLSQGNVEDLANVLQILLRNPNQDRILPALLKRSVQPLLCALHMLRGGVFH